MAFGIASGVITQGPDGVVLDQARRAYELVGRHLGVPYVTVSNALHPDYSGHTPLCFYDWPHATGPGAFARNRKMASQLTAVQREYAARVGLELD